MYISISFLPSQELLRNNSLLAEIRRGSREGEWLKETNAKQSDDELRWNAKVLGFRLAEMYSTSNTLMSDAHNETNDISDDAIYVVDSAMKTALSKDNKFIHTPDKRYPEGDKRRFQEISSLT